MPTPVPTPAPVPAPLPTPSAGGGSFFERLAAKRAAEAAAAAGGGTAGSSTPSSTPAPAPQAAAPSLPNPAFVAPDGRGFSDRSDYRKYMFETFYSFRGLCQPGSTHTKPPGSIAGQPFSIADCADTTLRLCDWSETVHIDRCSATRVLVAASCESVFLRNLTDCTITVACKQLRVRDCARCTVYLSAKTEPVIEASSGLVFAPYNCALGGLTGAFAAAALEPGVNHWDKVFDFSKDDVALPTPHWSTQGAF